MAPRYHDVLRFGLLLCLVVLVRHRVRRYVLLRQLVGQNLLPSPPATHAVFFDDLLLAPHPGRLTRRASLRLECLLCLEEQLLLAALLICGKLLDSGLPAVLIDWDAQAVDKANEAIRDLDLVRRVLLSSHSGIRALILLAPWHATVALQRCVHVLDLTPLTELCRLILGD